MSRSLFFIAKLKLDSAIKGATFLLLPIAAEWLCQRQIRVYINGFVGIPS